jgi:heme-degrading monooxygenase HmoA
MIARVIRSKVPEGAAERFAPLLEERAVPALKQQSGFRGGYWLHDPASGEALAVLLWDDEQAADAAEEQLRQRREETMREIGVTLQDVRVFQVIANT